MLINVSINLQQGDKWDLSMVEAAEAVLKALNGDEDKDTCTIQLITQPYEHAPAAPRPEPKALDVELPPLPSEPEVPAV